MANAQTKYIIQPVMIDGGPTLMWRASYKKREETTGGYATITDVDFSFNTREEASEFAHALLVKEGATEEEISME